ncbi:MAG: transposase [Streptococcaceae bacterium]|nr:transposase [Streptococcaceae bacterium]
MYESGQSVNGLSKEFEVSASTLYKWIDLYAKDERTGTNAELKAMRKEITELKQANDI